MEQVYQFPADLQRRRAGPQALNGQRKSGPEGRYSPSGAVRHRPKGPSRPSPARERTAESGRSRTRQVRVRCLRINVAQGSAFSAT